MISHPLTMAIWVHLLSGQLKFVPFLPCYIAIYSPWCGHRNLFKPKSDQSTLCWKPSVASYLNWKKILWPLVLTHPHPRWLQGHWPPCGSAAPIKLLPQGLCPCCPSADVLFSQVFHSLSATPLVKCHLLKEVFLITWNSSLCHSLSQYPVELFFRVLTLTYTWVFICLPSVFLHRHTAPWEHNFVHDILTPRTATGTAQVLSKSFLNDWMKWIFIP